MKLVRIKGGLGNQLFQYSFAKLLEELTNEEVKLVEAHDFDEDQVVLMLTEKEDVSGSETWYLDTGCLKHMTGNKQWLIDLDTKHFSKVRGRSTERGSSGSQKYDRSNS